MQNKILAIVGGGPRGLSALENFMCQMAKNKNNGNIQILFFEATEHVGHGPVYNLKQSESNWVNITERALTLEKRTPIEINNLPAEQAGNVVASFPSYHEWAEVDYKKLPLDYPDQFPPRSTIGKYLSQRFESITSDLENSNFLKVINEKVNQVHLVDNKIELTTEKNQKYNVDELLLTIGHQPTDLDEQLESWQKYSKENEAVQLFTEPYPIRQFFKKNKINSESVIALRGFGLAMIDVARGIMEKLGGEFQMIDEATKAVKFIPNEKTPKHFVPFSLNGLPMSPKPLNAKIDAWFEPSKKQIEDFAKQIGNQKTQAAAKSNQFLIEAFAPIASSIFLQLNFQDEKTLKEENIILLIKNWLEDETFEHSFFLSHKETAETMMRAFVKMSTGKTTATLDYCIGQVWRHCQPSIYQELSHNACSDEVVNEIIGLDERLKRYSYGPPVESLQQMLALIDAEVMTLKMVNDPEIELTKKGWELSKDKNSIVANMMVNSVLDAPKLLAVNSEIISNMLEDDLIQAVHNDLGIVTDECGYVISNIKEKKLPIAVLGRLAKGTIIGVDAILECFGERPERWAAQAIQNFDKMILKNLEIQ